MENDSKERISGTEVLKRKQRRIFFRFLILLLSPCFLCVIVAAAVVVVCLVGFGFLGFWRVHRRLKVAVFQFSGEKQFLWTKQLLRAKQRTPPPCRVNARL